MAARRKAKVQTEGQASDMERLTRLLALLVVKGESQPEKIKILAGVGFTNVEIAQLLGVSGNAVNITLHRLRAK